MKEKLGRSTKPAVARQQTQRSTGRSRCDNRSESEIVQKEVKSTNKMQTALDKLLIGKLVLKMLK